MQTLRQLSGGFLLAIFSIALVLGAFALALAEGGLVVYPTPSPSASPVFPTLFPTLPLLTQPGLNPLPSLPEASPTFTPPPAPTSCPPPQGWIPVLVQPFDTMDSLSLAYGLTREQFKQANCLVSDTILPGVYVYVPPRAPTVVSCGAPAGWATYIVRPGDTLYAISLLYRTTVVELQQANCLGASTYIYGGQALRVPNVPTSTATFTLVTPASLTPTDTLSNTPAPSGTDTPVPAPSDTPTPSDTPLPSDTPTPSDTPLPSDTPTP